MSGALDQREVLYEEARKLGRGELRANDLGSALTAGFFSSDRVDGSLLMDSVLKQNGEFRRRWVPSGDPVYDAVRAEAELVRQDLAKAQAKVLEVQKQLAHANTEADELEKRHRYMEAWLKMTPRANILEEKGT